MEENNPSMPQEEKKLIPERICFEPKLHAKITQLAESFNAPFEVMVKILLLRAIEHESRECEIVHKKLSEQFEVFERKEGEL